MSSSFIDSKGTEWHLEITLQTAKSIEKTDFSELTDQKISLFHPDNEFFQLLLSDTAVAFAVIWCIVKSQADAQSITEDEFCSRIKGQTIQLGLNALWEAITDFFPHRGKSISLLKSQYEKTLLQLEQRLSDFSPEMQKRVMKMLDQKLIETMNEIQ